MYVKFDTRIISWIVNVSSVSSGCQLFYNKDGIENHCYDKRFIFDDVHEKKTVKRYIDGM